MKTLALGVLISAVGLALGCSRDTSAHATSVRDKGALPDNTGVNARDRDASKLTPLDQSNEPRDLEITKQIRQAVVDDASLSTNAKNVKIITRGGKVTLRGPVSNDIEKSAVAAKAAAVAGMENVVNELDITVR